MESKSIIKVSFQKIEEIFDKKFVAFTDFMTLDKCLKFLADIDIAMFTH